VWLALGSQTRELRDGELVVGSGADADWRIATADLRPRHFTIVVYGLNASLRPTSKDNVVAVNDRQLIGATHLLNDGDVIAAGSGRFVFSDDAPRIESVEARTDPAYLIDDGAKVAHPLMSRSTTIGRDASNTIVLKDPSASRFHAEIRREAGGFALHTMGSAGTSRNGKKLGPPVLLDDGDVIDIAYVPFRFAREKPDGVAIAGLHDVTSDLAQRQPTLATGKLSVVPSSRGPGWLVLGIFGVLLLAALVALAFAR
jgi:pSer/pThr/pTyr-binding forkhead associated (FHA) protein